MIFRTGIGQDSHRFIKTKTQKPCVIGGVFFNDIPGMDADSDGDVVYHALCNAISSITTIPILGGIAIQLCREQGVTDSSLFVKEALKTLISDEIVHVAFSIEGSRPKLQSFVDNMRENISHLTQLNKEAIGITITSGDELTAFGKGEGLQCFCLITTKSL